MDGGKLLGETVHTADTDREDEVGTEIASEFVNSYMHGLKNGVEKKTGLPDNNIYEENMSGLRPFMGDVLAYYIGDVDQQIFNRNDDKTNPKESQGAYHLAISDKHGLAKLFANLAGDRPEELTNLDADPPTAIQKIILAHLIHTRSSLAFNANLPENLTAYSERHAMVLHYIRRSTEAGLEGTAKEKDEVNKLLQGIIKQGLDLIPAVKTIKGSGLGSVVSGPLIDKSLNKLLPADNLTKYQRTLPANENAYDTYHMEAVQFALRFRKDWAEGTSPQEWIADPRNEYGPEHSFVDGQGVILDRKDMTEAQREAYSTWWLGTAPSYADGPPDPTAADDKAKSVEAKGMSAESTRIRNEANSGWDTGSTQANLDLK
jgi:hypothetical protein